MATANRYLEGIDVKKPSSINARRTLLLWIALILLFIAAYNLLTEPNDPRAPSRVEVTEPSPYVIPASAVGVVVVLLVAWLASRRTGARDRALNEATLATEERRFDAAIEQIRAMLGKNNARWDAYALLAAVAERRGDFVEADELLSIAHLKLAPKGKERFGNGTFLSLLDARRAFVLIASGNLEAGEALLRAPRSKDVHPHALALFVRAEALLLEHRGSREALATLLQNERALLESSLGILDRALLAMLEKSAAGTPRGRIDLDDFERGWIATVAPGTRALMEVA